MDTTAFITLISATLQGDAMSADTIIMSLAGAIQLGALWWMKQTWANLTEYKAINDRKHHAIENHTNQVFNTLNDFRVTVAREYASKDDIREIKDLLQELSRDMKAKADK